MKQMLAFLECLRKLTVKAESRSRAAGRLTAESREQMAGVGTWVSCSSSETHTCTGIRLMAETACLLAGDRLTAQGAQRQEQRNVPASDKPADCGPEDIKHLFTDHLLSTWLHCKEG